MERSLDDALKHRGYTFRQHLEEAGWGERKPTVVDLDVEQRQALETRGAAGLKELLDRRGLWSFPAMEIVRPLPRRPGLLLAEDRRPAAVIVAPEGDAGGRSLAGEIAGALRRRTGIELPVIGDGEARADLLDRSPLIVVGGSHQNRLALALALRHATFFLDAGAPGEDGWAVTTHAGLNAAGRNVLQVAASPEHSAAALRGVLDAVAAEGERWALRHIHCIQPGTVMAAALPSWERFTAGLPDRLPQLTGRHVAAPQDPEALADLLAVGLDSGGIEKNFYNSAPVDIAILSARYYHLTADPRALRLFRALLFRLADYYLKTPGGASYPADLDFRLGLLILHFARLEHDPLFDEEDRLILSNLLLACTRSIHEYVLRMWPVAPDAPSRHNHETFPALSLSFAADYFSRYGVADIDAWRAYAGTTFSGGLWRRSKQRENSHLYEGFVFEHAAAWGAFNGRDLSGFAPGRLRQAVLRQIAATDNFLRPVDYGDTALQMRAADSVLARFLATEEDGVVRWYAGEGFARAPVFLPDPVLDFAGVRLGRRPTPPVTGDWEFIPMEPRFLREHAPALPPPFAWDKLAFRTGWGDDDQYLLLEGIGGKISHAHCDPNGIVRYNHLGRHWIVSNGYGRRAGVTNANLAWNTRVLGPDDHNMLVLRRGGDIVRDVPLSVLLQRGRAGNLLYATTALLGYGGLRWFRTCILIAGGCLLVIDRVQLIEPGLEAAHIEWNSPSRPQPRADGFRLEQEGVFLDLTSPSGWRVEPGIADQSACWKRVIEDGSYPHGRFPLAKLLFHLPGLAAGQTHCLATLLAATRGEPLYSLTQPEPGRLLIAGPHAPARDLRLDDGDLAIRAGRAACEIRFGPVPSLPETLDT